MRTRPIAEEALQKLLKAAPHSLLVGGQALAFWTSYYRIDATKDFPDGVTFDVDFLGTRRDARAMHAALGGTLYLADLDTHTPNAAKLYFKDFAAQGEMEIDFLGALAGGDEDGIRARAVQLQLGDQSIRIMHPIDVLRSRICNLAVIPGRIATPRYVAQAALAIKVARAHLEASLKAGNERHALKMAELVGDLATSRAGVLVWRQLALDVVGALPVDSFTSASFKQKRMPQLLGYLAKKRK